MADVLSQNEIDSLLTEMTVGAVDVDSLLQERLSKRSDIANYDFPPPKQNLEKSGQADPNRP